MSVIVLKPKNKTDIRVEVEQSRFSSRIYVYAHEFSGRLIHEYCTSHTQLVAPISHLRTKDEVSFMMSSSCTKKAAGMPLRLRRKLFTKAAAAQQVSDCMPRLLPTLSGLEPCSNESPDSHFYAQRGKRAFITVRERRFNWERKDTLYFKKKIPSMNDLNRVDCGYCSQELVLHLVVR